MKGIKKILLIPVRILSFFVSAISWVATKINEWLMDLCLFVLHQYQKVIPWLRKQENQKDTIKLIYKTIVTL